MNWIGARAVLTLFLATVLLAINATSFAEEPEQGFTPLFEKDGLKGWVLMGAAGFTNKDGVITCSGEGDYPTWLRSEEEYENFVLRFQFRLGKYDEGGIVLHAPLYGMISRVGIRIQLSDDIRLVEPLTNSTGAISGVLPPTELASRPLEEWNDVEITMNWPTLQVKVNGKLVQDVDVEKHPELKYRFRTGYLGLPDRGGYYQLRNVRIKKLPGTERPWQRLFNGKDFTGWVPLYQGAKFTVDDGDILAENGNGYLLTKEDYTNFELKLYLKTSWQSNGGIFFRWNKLGDRGNEIQIEDVPDRRNPTGSVYDRAPASEVPLQIGEWYPMQIFLDGPKVVVRVNGVTVTTYDKLNVRAGKIALQMHRRDSWIRFKDLQIKVLP
jgi:hypothetical protein